MVDLQHFLSPKNGGHDQLPPILLYNTLLKQGVMSSPILSIETALNLMHNAVLGVVNRHGGSKGTISSCFVGPSK